MTQATLGQARLGYNFAWLFDWRADLLCFFLPLFFAVTMIYNAMSGTLLAALALFTIAIVFPVVGSFHGAATWFHYTDQKNQSYYFGTGKRIFIFGIAPLLITLACAVAYACHLKDLVFWVYMIWTIQHLTQQNVGILLLYHNPGEATVPRGIEARSQQIPSIIFGLLFFVHQYVGPRMFNLFVFLSMLSVLLLSSHYMWCLFQKARSGAPVNVPAFLFWFLSVWFYFPMPFVDSYYKGMLLPLFVHWCQYVGLNWVLVARKHEASKAIEADKRRTVVAFLFFCAVGTAVFSTTIYFSNMANSEFVRSVLAGVVMAGSLVHYFQDAFIWRFREQFQRETILPFLKLKKATA